MPYYTWTNTYATGSGNTWTVYPSVTSGTITATQLTAGSIIQPMWNTTTSGCVLEPGWQWGTTWPRVLQPARPQLSQRELDAMLADEQRRTDDRRASRARIAGRAESLLASLLDEDQIRSYTQDGWFDVTGSAGGRYRINRNGQAGNVDELAAEGDHRVASLCIHPYGGFHDADAHAAQYLALVTDELSFRRTANRTPRRRPAGMAA